MIPVQVIERPTAPSGDTQWCQTCGTANGEKAKKCQVCGNDL